MRSTQQNSALVEENAATAKTLEQQAQAMDERIAFFRIDEAAVGGASPAVAELPAHKAPPLASKPKVAARANGSARPRANPVARTQTALAEAWEEF